jgi:very-short-patch-repair endonuclease
MANAFARKLRINGTGAERVLWAGLRDFKKGGMHFRRQAPFGKYIVDFCCHQAKLIVEVDGDQHGSDEGAAYEADRTAYLNSRGYRVLRFANWEVMRERQRVLDDILHVAAAPHPARHSAPRARWRYAPPQGGGEST